MLILAIKKNSKHICQVPAHQIIWSIWKKNMWIMFMGRGYGICTFKKLLGSNS